MHRAAEPGDVLARAHAEGHRTAAFAADEAVRRLPSKAGLGFRV